MNKCKAAVQDLQNLFKNTQVSPSQHTDSPSNAHEQNLNRFQPCHHKFQIKISNIVEFSSEPSKFSRIEREIDCIKAIFCHLDVDSATISDHHRLGKFSTDRSRPRDILITLTSIWGIKKILASAHKLKTFKDKIFFPLVFLSMSKNFLRQSCKSVITL